MSIRMLSISFLVFWVLIECCHCTSKSVRVLEKPNIRPLYFNASLSTEENKVTVNGRYQCPEDTKLSFFERYDGRLIKFKKVLNTKENTTECEIALKYDAGRYKPFFWLRSKTASERLFTFVSNKVNKNFQTEFSGTDCSVGVNRSTHNKTIKYISQFRNCDQSPRIRETFSIWLNKSGKIESYNSDVYCTYLNKEYMKYFKSRCSSDVSSDPFYIEFYDDKMAADNVKLFDLSYSFQPMETCSKECDPANKRWWFMPVVNCTKACVVANKRWYFSLI
ncbi:uncharacterized protein LOC134245433 [Saccostrea cucullata]|uniref:uncharacterized protein LOC134245433 n=1 Tax=Saccostrea cuccullata TaxID=36930 RepID=UPI002ED2485D